MEDYSPKPRLFNVNHQPIIGKSWSGSNALLDCVEQITIGDYVSFGHDVKILTGSHDYTLKGKERQDSFSAKPIVIKDGVWLASGVIICQGVTIGENAVVGAGSVVLHDIPANQLWAGSPARFIKKL